MEMSVEVRLKVGTLVEDEVRRSRYLVESMLLVIDVKKVNFTVFVRR